MSETNDHTTTRSVPQPTGAPPKEENSTCYALEGFIIPESRAERLALLQNVVQGGGDLSAACMNDEHAYMNAEHARTAFWSLNGYFQKAAAIVGAMERDQAEGHEADKPRRSQPGEARSMESVLFDARDQSHEALCELRFMASAIPDFLYGTSPRDDDLFGINLLLRSIVEKFEETHEGISEAYREVAGLPQDEEVDSDQAEGEGSTGHDPRPGPSWGELLSLEDNCTSAESFLAMLHDIIKPPDGIDEDDGGLDRFSDEARWGLAFTISDVENTVKDLKAFILKSYDWKIEEVEA